MCVCVCACVCMCSTLSFVSLSLRPYVPIIWPSEHTTQTHLLPSVHTHAQTLQAKAHLCIHIRTPAPLERQDTRAHTCSPWSVTPPQQTVTVRADTKVCMHKTHTAWAGHACNYIRGNHMKRQMTCLWSDKKQSKKQTWQPNKLEMYFPLKNILFSNKRIFTISGQKDRLLSKQTLAYLLYI